MRPSMNIAKKRKFPRGLSLQTDHAVDGAIMNTGAKGEVRNTPPQTGQSTPSYHVITHLM